MQMVQITRIIIWNTILMCALSVWKVYYYIISNFKDLRYKVP